MVTLQNVSRTMFVANLTHHSFAEDPGPFGHKMVTTRIVDHDPRTGILSPRRVSRMLPSSLRLLAGQVSEPLPNGVLECDEVKNGLKGPKQRLRVLRQTEDEPVESKAPVLMDNVFDLHPQEALRRARVAAGKATEPEPSNEVEPPREREFVEFVETKEEIEDVEDDETEQG
jgi:hypothetical protein